MIYLSLLRSENSNYLTIKGLLQRCDFLVSKLHNDWYGNFRTAFYLRRLSVLCGA